MGVILRNGIFGDYYGNTFDSSNSLTQSQMNTNAFYIYSYLKHKGWSDNAIAGMLGNIQHESSMNPGRWEGDNVGSGPGYGLVQWTPYTNYTDWCSSHNFSDPSEMDNNLARIIYELENGLQYYKTPGYPETFEEFTKSTKDPYYLACAFAWNYERSWVVLYGSEAEKEALRQKRGNTANSWYTYLTGQDPSQPSGGASHTKKNKYNFILFNKRRRGIYG